MEKFLKGDGFCMEVWRWGLRVCAMGNVEKGGKKWEGGLDGGFDKDERWKGKEVDWRRSMSEI